MSGSNKRPSRKLRQADLFASSARMPSEEAVDLTLASLLAYGPRHDVWVVAWSGGKDSTAILTLLVQLIEDGRVPRPQRLLVLYADTRQELPPLQEAAFALMMQLRRRDWIEVEVVRAPMDKRFLVYILGRGVPPPNNRTFRWCTRQIKVDPMVDAIEARLALIKGSVLVITGVRQGESAERDRRIEISCSRDDGECGQGWYQHALPDAKGVRGRIFTLAPLLHWRVCLVWDWLKVFAPLAGWDTALLADVYGGDEAEELAARTGCICCQLVDEDPALRCVVAMPVHDHYAPLLGLRAVYRRLRQDDSCRLKKTGLTAEGAIATGKNKQRKGPLTFEARLWALGEVLRIQSEVNRAAVALGPPGVDLLDADEEARVRELIAAGTWPQGWAGDEPTADTPMDAVLRDGTVQPLVFGASA